MPDLYHSERNLLQAAAEGKQITEAEIRVLTDRLARTRAALDACDEALRAGAALRDEYREAAEVFAHYYDAVCDELEGTDLAYLRARGTLNERYLKARGTVAAFDDPDTPSPTALNQPGPAEPDDRKGPAA